MIDSIILIFEKFQTIIVGFIGFGGVIYSIRKNASLARAQHDRHISHERSALRTALCAELEVIKSIFESRIDEQDVEADESILVPEYVSIQVYQQMLARIGLLTVSEIKLVMNAYLLISEIPTRLQLLSNGSKDYPGYIQITGKYIRASLAMHGNFIEVIDKALHVLKANSERNSRDAILILK